VDLPEDRAANAVVYGGALNELEKKTAPRIQARLGGGLAGAPPPQADTFFAVQRPEIRSDVAVNVTSGDTGELFEYRFSSPVTIKKDESAMLPFLQQPIGARKLLIYSENYGEHPMNAAELTNSTSKTLDGGPITVFDSSSYAGEALVTTLKAGDKRLISYSVDLGTRVTTQFDSSREQVREIHINRGTLTAHLALDETKTYTIRNVDQKAKTLIIEHPVRAGYKLMTLKPAETTATAYRFEVKLGADATEKFAVAEERTEETTTSVSNLTPDPLLAYSQNKALSDSARNQFQQILDSKRKIADLGSQSRQLDSEINGVVTDQNRIRENIRSLNGVSGQQDQVQKYARQLADQEVALASSRDRLSDLKKQTAAEESRLNSLIEKLSF
ncbi:MAG TPA: hypothetical protein VFW44_06605, partial [Bryobacteraceae bacterium]|nr:hypothetical protein [Bryobacteraceae bacterium]